MKMYIQKAFLSTKRFSKNFFNRIIIVLFSFVSSLFSISWTSVLGRSSCSQLFFKIAPHKNFALFTGKHKCWSLFLINLQGLQHRYSLVNAAKFLRTVFSQNDFDGCFWLGLIFNLIRFFTVRQDVM